MNFTLAWLYPHAKSNIQTFTIDAQEMAIEKNKISVKNGETFVSTNDVLFSWCMRSFKATFGVMVVNFRNRLASHDVDDSRAGNYENFVSLIVCSNNGYNDSCAIQKQTLRMLDWSVKV